MFFLAIVMEKDRCQILQNKDKFPPVLTDRGKFLLLNTLSFIPETESAILIIKHNG